MITIKLDIQTKQIDRIKQYQHQYSTYLHLAYNRLLDGMLLKDCFKMTNYNNIELLDSWLRQCASREALSIIKKNKDKDKDKKVIFGGRLNYFNRLKGLITKEQYQQNRLSPIYSIGQNNYYGNRKFFIKDINNIIFKPNRKQHIELQIKASKKYQQYLKILMKHQQNKDLSITYQLTTKYITIIFDQKILQQKYKQYKPINNRIISIDMNPNYIGWSVIDWKNSDQFKLIDKGILSIKQINDYDNQHPQKLTYITNKRNYQVLQCFKFLIQKMIHYKCSLFTIEDLNIKSSNLNKGKRLNKLINNNWCRTKLVNNITKWCSIYNIQLLKIKPEYSSFIGNIVYRSLKLPDMVLASIEISRRGYQFYHQYITKDKQQEKNIVWINETKKIKSLIIQSLEELDIKDIIWNNLFDLYKIIKKSKCKYRFPLQINKESLSHLKLRYQNYII